MSSPLPPGVELEARIGEGGIADVFSGVWEGRPVAFKVLRDPDRPGLRKRFLREGRLLMRLEHPGLPRCYAVLDGPTPVLVLELLRGASLDVRLLSGPVSAEDGVRVASAALRALAYLHEHGIVHRDVKSANLWMGEDGRIVLLDLGLAADAADPLTTTLGDILGTHAYMAPEQIAGAETDHRVDLYSLGITLYEAACGERPYRAKGLTGYLHAHRAAGALPLGERVPEVPPRLAALVDRLMARDPAARPASASIALALLTGAAGVRRALEAPASVGREAVAGAAQAVLDAGGVLRLTGEIGSGLGLAARQVRALARADGIEQITLRCRARTGPSEAVAALARDLEGLVGAVTATEAGVVGAIQVLVAQDGRFLVIVEDLDLAAPGVDALIGRLAAVPGVAVVVGGRALPEAPAGREVALRPLALAEVRALVAGMLGTAAVPVGLDVGLHAASGGLPALVVAILREQAATGALWCDGVTESGRPRWSWDPTAPLQPGADTVALLSRALAALPAGTRRIVEALAVAGEPLPLEIALAAAEVDPSGLDLGPALRQGLVAVTNVGGEEWASIRRAVLEPLLLAGIAEERQAELHLLLADAARGRPTREWEQRFVYLHLALGAREPEDTARLVLLGDWLVSAGRPLVALGVLDAATRLPLEAGETLARLALARADALAQLARLAEARVALETGRALAAACGDDTLVARAGLAHLELALALGGRLPEGAEARLAAGGPEGDARTLLVWGDLRLRHGDVAGAEGAYGAALERAPPGPGDRAGVLARLGLARLAGLRGEHERAGVLLRGLAAELRAVDRPIGACEATVELARGLLSAGRLARAAEVLGAARTIASARGGAPLLPMVGLAEVGLRLAAFDIDGAAAALDAHRACAEPHVLWALRAQWLGLDAELREMREDGPAALEAHLRAAEQARTAEDALLVAFHSGMAAILTADSAGVGDALDALTGIGAPRYTARLLLLGGLVGRDEEVLAAAEVEARAAGDALLLLRALYARREPRGGEAAMIARAASDGLSGALRDRFHEAAPVRWARGERAGGRRDTGG